MKFGSIRNRAELLGAAATMGVGGFAIWEGSRYPVGALTHMGPGYFPILLGIIMVGLGLILLIQASPAPGPRPALRLGSSAAVFGAVAAFGFLVGRLGLVPATIALVLISSLATPPIRPLPVLLLAVALAGIAVALFIHGLGLPLRAFRWG